MSHAKKRDIIKKTNKIIKNGACDCACFCVGVACGRVGAWVCGSLGVGVFCECFLCVCVFFFSKKNSSFFSKV